MIAFHRIVRAAFVVLAVAGTTQAVAQQRPAAPAPPQQPSVQTPPGTRIEPAVIAVVDMQRISQNSKASMSVRGQMEQLRTQVQAIITRQEEALRAEEQELTRQRSVLAPQAFQDRERAFRQRVGRAQEQIQDMLRELEVSGRNALGEIDRAISLILVDVTRQRGVNIVLTPGQFVFAERELEITDEVLGRLDATLTSVRVQAPASIGGASAPPAQQPRPPAQAPAQQPRR